MVSARIRDVRVVAGFRKLRKWLCLVLGSGCFTFVLQLSIQNLEAQESRAWMIPGSAARGLSATSGETEGKDAIQSWMADIDEADWDYIIIHHSGTESGSLESIHKQHLQRRDSEGNRWLGIGYHFLIGNGRGMPDGTVQATFRWKEQMHGAHSGDAMFNARGIGICVIGNFENAAPSTAQLKSLKALVKALAVRHRITPENFMGHGSVKATACPGKHFPLNEIRQVISKTKS